MHFVICSLQIGDSSTAKSPANCRLVGVCWRLWGNFRGSCIPKGGSVVRSHVQRHEIVNQSAFAPEERSGNSRSSLDSSLAILREPFKSTRVLSRNHARSPPHGSARLCAEVRCYGTARCARNSYEGDAVCQQRPTSMIDCNRRSLLTKAFPAGFRPGFASVICARAAPFPFPIACNRETTFSAVTVLETYVALNVSIEDPIEIPAAICGEARQSRWATCDIQGWNGMQRDACVPPWKNSSRIGNFLATARNHECLCLTSYGAGGAMEN